ncbi:hypothetical protein EYF80_066924 [Liparis tanakae]|uniref:Uncharacterized protein n=1 Tax=Liparis tanakae TaxID=230148 RepID=A0A4Z2E343_9TELE|nr:hypothetical protein EYF80_066924 [Liparis tanakae]
MDQRTGWGRADRHTPATPPPPAGGGRDGGSICPRVLRSSHGFLGVGMSPDGGGRAKRGGGGRGGGAKRVRGLANGSKYHRLKGDEWPS